MHQLHLGLGDLLVGHGAIGGAEVDDLRGYLADARTRTNRLVVNLHAGVGGAELREPARVDGVGEGGAGAGEMLRIGNRGSHGRHQDGQQELAWKFDLHVVLLYLRFVLARRCIEQGSTDIE